MVVSLLWSAIRAEMTVFGSLFGIAGSTISDHQSADARRDVCHGATQVMKLIDLKAESASNGGVGVLESGLLP